MRTHQARRKKLATRWRTLPSISITTRFPCLVRIPSMCSAEVGQLFELITLYRVITWSDVHNLIFAAVYSPIQSFPFAANVLAALERGEGRAFSELLRGYHEFTCPAPAGSGFSIIPLRNQSGAAMSYDATMAIACSDGDIQSNTNRTAYREHVKELMRISPTIGSLWANARLQCVHYSIVSVPALCMIWCC